MYLGDTVGMLRCKLPLIDDLCLYYRLLNQLFSLSLFSYLLHSVGWIDFFYCNNYFFFSAFLKKRRDFKRLSYRYEQDAQLRAIKSRGDLVSLNGYLPADGETKSNQEFLEDCRVASLGASVMADVRGDLSVEVLLMKLDTYRSLDPLGFEQAYLDVSLRKLLEPIVKLAMISAAPPEVNVIIYSK